MSHGVHFHRARGQLRVEVSGIPDWDGFEKIVRFLENEYKATVDKRFDGPDARRWLLRVGTKKIEVHHEDPWGNTIVSPAVESDPVVEQIGRDLAQRLSDLVPVIPDTD